MKEIRDRYEIFLKVCETGSFSKAAEALNYTQSGISQMMAGFEEELGVQLFARAKKGVTLTDNGRMLMPYIQEMTNQKDKLRQAAFNINHKIEGKLRIGSFSSVTAMWMPEVIHYFNRNYPQVEVQIFADSLKFYPLCEDPLCAVMQKNHPLAEKKSVRLEELLEYPFIIETPGCDNDILHLLERCGKEPKTSYSFRDDTLIMAFVKNGLGVTISQKLVMKAFANDVESRPLEPWRSRIIGLAFVKTMNSVVTKILLEYLKGMM